MVGSIRTVDMVLRADDFCHDVGAEGSHLGVVDRRRVVTLEREGGGYRQAPVAVCSMISRIRASIRIKHLD